MAYTKLFNYTITIHFNALLILTQYIPSNTTINIRSPNIITAFNIRRTILRTRNCKRSKI